MACTIRDWSENGVKVEQPPVALPPLNIWLIDPRKRKAWSYTSDGKRESTAVLATAEPRLTLRLDEIFTKLDDYVGD